MNNTLSLIYDLLDKVDEASKPKVEVEVRDFLRVYNSTRNKRTLKCFIVYLQGRVDSAYSAEVASKVTNFIEENDMVFN